MTQSLLLSGKGGWCAGHRSIKCDSLPLKRGMLVFAFSRKMPVQVPATTLIKLAMRGHLWLWLTRVLETCCGGQAANTHDAAVQLSAALLAMQVCMFF